MSEVGTQLGDLDVKEGEVVLWQGDEFVVMQKPKPSGARSMWAGNQVDGWISETALDCRIVSRANPEPTVNYNDGNWHVHRGGKCPVHSKSKVDITYFDGVTSKDVQASSYLWGQPLMFRVTKEHKEPREFWIDTVDMTVTTEPCHANSFYIKVREVTE